MTQYLQCLNAELGTMNDELKAFRLTVQRSAFSVHSFKLTTPVGQHALDALLVGLCNHHVDVEDALALGRLLRQDVARVRVAALDLARRGRAETLRRALVCLQFRHDNLQKAISCWPLAISFD